METSNNSNNSNDREMGSITERNKNNYDKYLSDSEIKNDILDGNFESFNLRLKNDDNLNTNDLRARLNFRISEKENNSNYWYSIMGALIAIVVIVLTIFSLFITYDETDGGPERDGVFWTTIVIAVLLLIINLGVFYFSYKARDELYYKKKFLNFLDGYIGDKIIQQTSTNQRLSTAFGSIGSMELGLSENPLSQARPSSAAEGNENSGLSVRSISSSLSRRE